MPNSHPRPWHQGSTFGDGPRRPLDREQRARFRFLLNTHARANRLPAKQEKVGLALLKRLGKNGQCDPTHETLAHDAGCKPRTVRRALDGLKALGLVAWTNRLVRDGWRAAQTSNAYLLLFGSPPANQPAACDGQRVRQTSFFDKSKKLLPADPIEITAAQGALAKARRVIEARLLNKGRG